MQLNDWLVQQKDRRDAVGALARRFLTDASGPLWANNPRTFHQYLTDRDADKDAFHALEWALQEWSEQTCNTPSGHKDAAANSGEQQEK